jgi:hypothetical protein
MKTVRDLMEGTGEGVEFSALQNEIAVKFLGAAAKAIKAFAKGHVTKAEVNEGRNHAATYLSVEATTLGDIEFSWTCQIMVVDTFACELHAMTNRADERRTVDSKMRLAMGECTPAKVVELFKQAYGI